jgi:hypothetical protein
MIDKSRLGPFVLEQRLGNQPDGAVYHAVHVQRRRAMAVRIMSQHLGVSGATVEEFAKEVEFLKTLEHRNVVRVYGGGVFDDDAYTAMELIKGQSLDELVRRGPLPWETVIDYLSQACQGLEYAHQRGTIHQNLTTAKLILSDSGQIKITDFRGDRLNQFDRWNDVQPRRAAVAYMAPEQLRGERSITLQADLYALGCIMYELLTGHLPFEADNVAELREKHLNEVPAKIRTEIFDCPIWLETLVAQLLEKDPARRPHFASSVKVALDEVKEKTALGAGVAQHAVRGSSSALRVPEGDTEVRRLLKPKAKKRPTQQWVPFYERVWFMAACAAVAVALVAWAFWPVSEEYLFANAQSLMASDNPADWQTARERYIDPMLQRFPTGKFAAQANGFIDKIDIEQARRRFEVNQRLGRDPRNVVERRYLQAWRKYEEGDPQAALEEYQRLVADFPATGDDAPFVKLARAQIAAIQAELATIAARAAAEKADPTAEKSETATADQPAAPASPDPQQSLPATPVKVEAVPPGVMP